MQVFFGSFRGRGFPLNSAAARPSSAEEQPAQASAELAALVAQSLAEAHMQDERTEADAAASVQSLNDTHKTPREAGSEAPEESPVPRQLDATSACNVTIPPAAATSPAASSPQL